MGAYIVETGDKIGMTSAAFLTVGEKVCLTEVEIGVVRGNILDRERKKLVAATKKMNERVF